MQFIWDVLPTENFIISLIFIVLIYGLMFFVFLKVGKRKASFVTLGISAFFTIGSFLFNLIYVSLLCACFTSANVSIVLFANLGDLRTFLANPFKRTNVKVGNFGVEKIYNREELYKKIETAVITLSKARVGAIITFEKNTSLKDVIKNGVPVNAPVTPELLATIFYPGTRMHDGAVVIHGNEIMAASVFYTPTTKPFAGKYGSRHRAAIGISEISDAVTVVVSEETGRISLAINGVLEAVDQSNFLRVFENVMSENVEEE